MPLASLKSLVKRGKPFTDSEWGKIAVLAMTVFLIYSALGGQSLVAYFFVLAVCALAIFRHPQVGLYIIIVSTMWFERYFTLQPVIIGGVPYKIYPLDLILALTFFSALYRFSQRELTLKFRRFDAPIILFGVYATAGYALAWFRRLDPSLAFGTYKNYFLYAVVYLLIAALASTRDDWKKLLNWFYAGGLGLFFFLAYGIIAGKGLWSEFTPLSTYGERLLAGTHVFYMALFGFWLIALYLWREHWQKKIPQWVITGLMMLVVVGILVSLVRHLWVALAGLSAVWMILFSKEERKKMLVFAGWAAGLAAAFLAVYLWVSLLYSGTIPKIMDKTIYAFKQRVGIESVVLLEDSSFRWRVSVWKAGLGLWATAPVFGTGLGRLIVGFDGITPFEVAVRELHNNYLGILIQLGIAGIFIIAWWFCWLIKRLFILWKASARDLFLRQMIFSWGSAVLLFMIVFSVSVYWDVNFFVIWWWLALAGVRFADKELNP